MRPTLVLALIAGACGLALVGSPAGHATTQPKTILVKFNSDVNGSTVVTSQGDDPTAVIKPNVVVVNLKDGETVDQGLADYGASAVVTYAEPDPTYSAALDPPNDPSFSSQWALNRIEAVTGWSVYPGSYGTTGDATVAVVDTGIDTTNSDLSDGRVLTASGANCLSGTCVSDPAADDNGHGTNVAGVLAGSTNDGAGIAGEAYSSSLLPVKVLDSAGSGTAGSIAAGIIWAADHGARVLNLSLAGPFSQTICDAVAYATSAGTLVVAAAGNSGVSTPTYPAACPGAVGVAATDSTDHTPYWSNYGNPNVFVSAPGVSVLTAARGGSTTTVDGTSIAAPYVSGLAALLFSENPFRTAGDVKSILAQTSDKIGGVSYGSDPYSTCGGCTWNSNYGYGRINAASALSYPAAAPRDFALTATPASATVGQGSSTSASVYVDGRGGYAGTVNLSVDGLPANATASFSPASVAAFGSSQLTITAPSSTPTGTYTLTITGSDGTTTHTTTVTLSVITPDFAVSASPASATVNRGSSTSYTVSVQSLGGFSATTALSVTGVPTYATGTFSYSSVPVPGYSTLTVKTGTSTALGTYTLTIKGTSGTLVHQTTVTLNVVAPDFTVSATPSSATVLSGQSAAYTVSIGALNGFTGSITMSASGYPSNATLTWSASSVAAPGTTTLTVRTATTTAGGTYTLTIKGTSSSRVVRSATVTLVVHAPDFTVSASPSPATVVQGQSTTLSVAVGVLYGFTGNITMSASGYSTGVTVSYSPSIVAAPGSSTLTLTASATALVGTYTLTIKGTSSSSVVRSTTVTLIVNPTGDFAMSASASSFNVTRGSYFTPTVYFAPQNGFYCTVHFSNSALPAGLTATWTKTYLLVSGTSTVSTTVKFAATTSTVPGAYSVNLIGTCGSLVHTVPLTVTVI